MILEKKNVDGDGYDDDDGNASHNETETEIPSTSTTASEGLGLSLGEGEGEAEGEAEAEGERREEGNDRSSVNNNDGNSNSNANTNSNPRQNSSNSNTNSNFNNSVSHRSGGSASASRNSRTSSGGGIIKKTNSQDSYHNNNNLNSKSNHSHKSKSSKGVRDKIKRVIRGRGGRNKYNNNNNKYNHNGQNDYDDYTDSGDREYERDRFNQHVDVQIELDFDDDDDQMTRDGDRDRDNDNDNDDVELYTLDGGEDASIDPNSDRVGSVDTFDESLKKKKKKRRRFRKRSQASNMDKSDRTNSNEKDRDKEKIKKRRRRRFSLMASRGGGGAGGYESEPQVISNNPNDLMSRSRHIRKSMGFIFDDDGPAPPPAPRGFEAVEAFEPEPKFTLGDPIHDDYLCWGKFRNKAGAWINSGWVQTFVTSLIVANALLLGALTYLFDNPEATHVLEQVDLVMLCMFTFEICTQLLYLGVGEFAKNGWMLFDGFIILFSWIFVDSQLSIFRSFRIFRLFALVSRWTSLRRLFKAVGRTMPKMATIGAALMLFFYTFCVLYTSLYHNLWDEGYLDYDYFGRLDFTFLTLFQFMTLDSYTGVVRQVMNKHPYAWLGFCVWVVITAFFVLNLVVAVICESLIELHSNADESHQNKLLNHQKGMMESQTEELVNETRQVVTLQKEMLANQVAMATTLVEIMKHLKESQQRMSLSPAASNGGRIPLTPTGERAQYNYGRKESLAKLIKDVGELSSEESDDNTRNRMQDEDTYDDDADYYDDGTIDTFDNMSFAGDSVAGDGTVDESLRVKRRGNKPNIDETSNRSNVKSQSKPKNDTKTTDDNTKNDSSADSKATMITNRPPNIQLNPAWSINKDIGTPQEESRPTPPLSSTTPARSSAPTPGQTQQQSKSTAPSASQTASTLTSTSTSTLRPKNSNLVPREIPFKGASNHPQPPSPKAITSSSTRSNSNYSNYSNNSSNNNNNNAMFQEEDEKSLDAFDFSLGSDTASYNNSFASNATPDIKRMLEASLADFGVASIAAAAASAAAKYSDSAVSGTSGGVGKNAAANIAASRTATATGKSTGTDSGTNKPITPNTTSHSKSKRAAGSVIVEQDNESGESADESSVEISDESSMDGINDAVSAATPIQRNAKKKRNIPASDSIEAPHLSSNPPSPSTTSTMRTRRMTTGAVSLNDGSDGWMSLSGRSARSIDKSTRSMDKSSRSMDRSGLDSSSARSVRSSDKFLSMSLRTTDDVLSASMRSREEMMFLSGGDVNDTNAYADRMLSASVRSTNSTKRWSNRTARDGGTDGTASVASSAAGGDDTEVAFKRRGRRTTRVSGVSMTGEVQDF